MKEKTPLSHGSCVLSDAWFGDLKFEIKFVENYFFLENYVTSEGAVFHNFYITNLSPLLFVRFYANNYFEYLLIVSAAFN